MALLTLDVQVVENFFDKEKVIKASDAQTRRALSRIGAIVRRSGRQSIRRRKKASRPGEPPSARSKDRVRTPKNIRFAFDRATHSVLVGMVKLPGSKHNVPELLEHGGVGPVGHQKARPTMGPALKREHPKFEGFWESAVG